MAVAGSGEGMGVHGFITLGKLFPQADAAIEAAAAALARALGVP